MFVFVSFLSIFSAPCVRWRSQVPRFLLNVHSNSSFSNIYIPTYVDFFLKQRFCSNIWIETKTCVQTFWVESNSCVQAFWFRTKTFVQTFLFWSCIFVQTFWMETSSESSKKFLQPFLFWTILFNFVFQCNIILFKHVSSNNFLQICWWIKVGFRSNTFFRLLVSKQTFFKKVLRKDKSLRWVFLLLDWQHCK